MGRPKQLLPYHGGTLLDHAISSASNAGCAEVYVVIGAQYGKTTSASIEAAVHFVENVTWYEGIASSIRAGVNAAISRNKNLEAVLITLTDQPLVGTEILGRLVASFFCRKTLAIASTYSGTLGVPAVFSCELFSELLSLRGEEGAKRVLLRHQEEIVSIPVSEAAFDVDVLSDYEALLQR